MSETLHSLPCCLFSSFLEVHTSKEAHLGYFMPLVLEPSVSDAIVMLSGMSCKAPIPVHYPCLHLFLKAAQMKDQHGRDINPVPANPLQSDSRSHVVLLVAFVVLPAASPAFDTWSENTVVSKDALKLVGCIAERHFWQRLSDPHRSSLKSASKTGPPIPHHKRQYGIPTALLRGVTETYAKNIEGMMRRTTWIPFKVIWVTMYGGRVKEIRRCGWGEDGG